MPVIFHKHHFKILRGCKVVKNTMHKFNTYACKFPIRAQARKAGPPKKLFRSSLLILKSCYVISWSNNRNAWKEDKVPKIEQPVF